LAGEVCDQRLDRVRHREAALMKARLIGQGGKQVRQAPARGGQKASVRTDAQQYLGDAERDNLRVGELAPGVLSPSGQEIVSGAEHRNTEQVEVGEHRGPLRVDGEQQAPPTSTSLRYVPHSTVTAVESLI